MLLTGDPLGPGAPLSPCKQKGRISFVDRVGCLPQAPWRSPPSLLPYINKYFLSETNGSLKLDSRDPLFEQNCWGQVSLIPISPGAVDFQTRPDKRNACISRQRVQYLINFLE